jgi:hypothetical protein
VATTWFIGNLLTGRRIQTLPVLAGTWSELLNADGDLSCTVSMRNRQVRRLGLRESAIPGASFLAVFSEDTGLQAGPIWMHDWDDDSQRLTLTASGMWSYFDHRMVLPVLAGRLPTDPTTNTRFTAVSSDPDDPWPTDTRKSLQGMARALVAQAQSWTSGNVPVVLPAEIAGTSERLYRGADLATVGRRLRELSQVEGGPDIRFTPRFTSDRLGVEWVMEIGTPTQPLLFSTQEPVFNYGLPRSSVSRLRVQVDGRNLASQAYALGGRAAEQSLVAVATNSALTAAGFPVLEVSDTARATVTELTTLQAHADERVARGRLPIRSLTFDHDISVRPFVGAFHAGDFVRFRVRDNSYLDDGEYRLRVTARSGDARGRRLALTLQPEVT